MTQIYKIAILMLAGLHLTKTVIKTDLTVIFVVAVIVLLFGVIVMGQGFKKITITFMILGVFVLTKFEQPFSAWVTALNSMTNVIAILVIMQMFTIPIEVGRYNLAIRYWFNKSFKGEGGLFLFTTVATHVFTSFLMLGAIPVVISLMEDTLKTRVSHYERFISTAISRGYVLASLWAPGAVNIALVVQATGVSWSKLFFPGISLAIIGIVLSYFLETRLAFSAKGMRFTHSVDRQGERESLDREHRARHRAWHIIIVVVSLSTLTLLLAKLNLGSSSSPVILAGAIVVLVWILQFRREPKLQATLWNYWDVGVLKAADIAPFFIAIGLFTSALEQSGVINIFQGFLQNYANSFGIFSIVLIPLVMICLAVLGIHPFISIVMFGQVLTALHLPVSDVTVALCLALGASTSFMVSPFAGVIMAISKFVNVKTQDVALRWNWVFCLAFFSVGIMLAYFWGKILG
ncbi:hypothetical protein UF75_0672 [Desulfosporosinus sp. I2]|uniref:hypothetical protein n=1 Tax=Desulfosporosinus sp. I2 TaxID=1617025 RepID=UPI0005EF4021|nr:hypothetical protein [Desulfosporosinus sp. I2]KJR48962.1 hypothetical protein UF75_0672 [Desulfosporosinus sp. I2]